MKAQWKKPRARKAKKAMAKKPTVALVKAVAKKVVSDALEDKYQTRLLQTSGYPRLFDAGITSVFPLMPVINQGTESNNRIGDRIRPKRMRVDFTVSANYDLSSSLVTNVRLMVLQDKSIKDTLALPPSTGVQPGTPISTELLQYATQVTGYTATPTDDTARVNYERYTVIKDIHREVLKGYGIGPNVISNGLIGDQTFVGSQITHKFSVVIPTPAVLRYSQQLDDYPTNFAPFFVLGYTNPGGFTGNTPDNWLSQRIACNAIVHFDFEDA